MEKKEYPILVKVSSAECDTPGHEDNVMRMMMPGTLTRHPDGWLISYTEALQEDDGHQVTHEVRVLAKNDRVTVLRKGPYGMMMVLQPDVPYQGTYHTPYGDMQMDVIATRVHTALAQGGGTIRMEYQLRVGGGEALVRRMSIEYKARAC